MPADARVGLCLEVGMGAGIKHYIYILIISIIIIITIIMIYQWLEYTDDNAFNGWNIPFRIPINTNRFL